MLLGHSAVYFQLCRHVQGQGELGRESDASSTPTHASSSFVGLASFLHRTQNAGLGSTPIASPLPTFTMLFSELVNRGSALKPGYCVSASRGVSRPSLRRVPLLHRGRGVPGSPPGAIQHWLLMQATPCFLASAPAPFQRHARQFSTLSLLQPRCAGVLAQPDPSRTTSPGGGLDSVHQDLLTKVGTPDFA